MFMQDEFCTMNYVEQHDLVIVASNLPNGRVVAVTLPRKQKSGWKLSGDIKGKCINPQGMCHDDAGRLYVADGKNDRVLVLDSLTGRVLQILFEEDEQLCT